MRINDLVKFAKPTKDEIADRFIVLELRGDRVLVGMLNTGMRIMPSAVYLVADLVQA